MVYSEMLYLVWFYRQWHFFYIICKILFPSVKPHLLLLGEYGTTD